MAPTPTPVLDKSYLPQYISYLQPPDYTKLDNGNESAPPQVLVYPKINPTPNTPSTGGGCPDPTPNTPLLANKKKSVSHAPTKTNFFGIFLAFISGVFFTLCSSLVKFLTGVDPMELLIMRSLFQVAVTLPIALHQGHNVLGPQGSRPLLFIQGLVGGTTLVLLFYSFRLLPLGDAATIIFSSPVFVMVMSHIWLREPCGFYRTIIVVLLVSGVVFITKPPFLFTNAGPDSLPGESEAYNIIGYCCALFGTLFTAMNIVVMRKCKDVHFSVVVFQFSFWSLIISTAILFFNTKGSLPEYPDQTPFEWLLVLLVAVFGLSGQVLVAIALAHEGAGRVAVTRSMDIVLAYVLQVIIFHEVPDWTSVMGAGMVIVCVVGMGVEDVVHKFLHGK